MFFKTGRAALTTDKNWRIAFVRAMRKVLAISITSSLFSLSLIQQAHAQAISNGLDPAFGGNGIVITNFFTRPHPIFHSYDSASDVVIQPDGKIVVVGTSTVYPNSDFAVARYHSNGSLDKTFNSDGKQTIDFHGGSAEAVALQPDGKIVVAGSESTTDGSDFALARLDRVGNLDRTFGTGGKIIADFFSDDKFARAYDVAVQPDGKIVVAGTVNKYTPGFIGLLRYNRDGSLDDGSASDSTPSDSFGNRGRIIEDFGEHAEARAMIIQPDGKIVVGGAIFYSDTPGYPHFVLARYNSDGSPDPTFDDDGKQITEFFSDDYSQIAGLVLQPDGKIVAAGNAGGVFALARYNPNGSLDTTFDGDGKQTTSLFSSARAEDVAILPDGKIMVAGTSPDPNGAYPISFGPHFDFALARYHSDGSLDTTFDDDGKLSTNIFCGSEGIDLTGGSYDLAYAIAAQPDGKVVVAGRALGHKPTGYFTDFAVVRYPVDATSTAPRLLSLALIETFCFPCFPISTVVGGATLRGRVKLCSRAPNDVVITLANNGAPANVPTTVKIPAGTSTATFTIKSMHVTEIETGTITASLGTTTKSALLRVRPIGVSSLTINPNTVQGSHGVTGTVALERPAPAGGIVVTLSSSDLATAYPTVSQITVSPGSSRRSFMIRTRNVPSSRSALIRATANGKTGSALLVVQ